MRMRLQLRLRLQHSVFHYLACLVQQYISMLRKKSISKVVFYGVDFAVNRTTGRHESTSIISILNDFRQQLQSTSKDVQGHSKGHSSRITIRACACQSRRQFIRNQILLRRRYHSHRHLHTSCRDSDVGFGLHRGQGLPRCLRRGHYPTKRCRRRRRRRDLRGH